MLEFRARNRISESYIAEQMVGKLLTDKERVITLNPAGGPVRLLQPDGRPLCTYLPGVVKDEFAQVYPTLQKIRGTTSNRGAASGTQRVKKSRGSRTYAKEVASSIIGAFDAYGPNQYCRLTAYNAKQLDEFTQLVPLFQRMSSLFAEHVPDRYAAQAEFVEKTAPDWVVPGTVYTTITVNSTYPTGVHTDKGDLDEGFSCLAVGRRGDFYGGILTFPAFGVGVDMHDGDMILMDAHAWHGNTNIYCSRCHTPLDKPGHRCEEDPGQGWREPERISVVAYYRTGMKECGTLADEDVKRFSVSEAKTGKALGVA